MRLRKARALARELEARLKTAGRPPLGNELAPLRGAVAVALEEPMRFAPQMDPEARALRRLRVYWDALARDAEITWDAIEEPPLPLEEPRVVFRPSGSAPQGDEEEAA